MGRRTMIAPVPSSAAATFNEPDYGGLSSQTGKISAVQIYASQRKNTGVAPNINTIPH
jgi:hypothetical protein